MKAFYEDRGCGAPWESSAALDLKPLPAHDTDDRRRMLWLKTSVRPMLERLKVRHSVHELRELLGLLYKNT